MDYQPPPNGRRTFLITWATQAVSVFGTALTLFAMNIWLTQTMYPRPEQRPQLAWALAAALIALPGLARQGVRWAPLNRLLAPLASGAGLAMKIDAATFLVAAVALLFLFIGRVFSVRRLIAQCTYPLGAALAGLLGGLLDPGLIIAALGCLLVIFCIAQLFNPYLLRVEDKTMLDNMAAQAEARPV